MNNLFLEGPIQTGKSTLIREVIRRVCGSELDGSAGISGKGIGGFSVQRISFPTPGSKKRMGFRLTPASAPLWAHTCVTTTDDKLIAGSDIFKLVGCTGGSRVDLDVFETVGVQLLKQALEDAKAGRINIVLLDEIGGHEMVCGKFMALLNEILDSDIPCIGVIKLRESAARMAGQDPLIVRYNEELHKKITGPDGGHGEILYYERGDEAVRTAVIDFVNSHLSPCI
ncbi:MAG: nucleoside-triphosphatase [Bacillota bacterium]|nr:nucleoside-triphosphatase [Bacillota bacterium]